MLFLPCRKLLPLNACFNSDLLYIIGAERGRLLRRYSWWFVLFDVINLHLKQLSSRVNASKIIWQISRSVKLPSCHSTSLITSMFSVCCPLLSSSRLPPIESLFYPSESQRQTFSTYLKPRVNSPTVSLSFNWPRLWPDSCCLNLPGTFSSLSFLHRLLCEADSRPNAATRKSSAGIVLYETGIFGKGDI